MQKCAQNRGVALEGTRSGVWISSALDDLHPRRYYGATDIERMNAKQITAAGMALAMGLCGACSHAPERRLETRAAPMPRVAPKPRD